VLELLPLVALSILDGGVHRVTFGTGMTQQKQQQHANNGHGTGHGNENHNNGNDYASTSLALHHLHSQHRNFHPRNHARNSSSQCTDSSCNGGQDYADTPAGCCDGGAPPAMIDEIVNGLV
jgi:hypothetical protein